MFSPRRYCRYRIYLACVLFYSSFWIHSLSTHLHVRHVGLLRCPLSLPGALFLSFVLFWLRRWGVGFHWEISISIGAWTIFVKTWCLAKLRGFLLFWWLRLCANRRNIVGCYILRPFAHPVACCCLLLRKVWNQSNFSAKNPQHFYCSVIAEVERNNVRSVCTALATLLGPRKLITHGLQRLMGCILSTMHCRSQHCWQLLHPFAHHF